MIVIRNIFLGLLVRAGMVAWIFAPVIALLLARLMSATLFLIVVGWVVRGTLSAAWRNR
jgi:hypothetical protein